MEASLTCAVCLSVFENPTTLPVCSHNFCKKCILECVTKSFSYGLDYGGGGGGGSNIWKNSQLECPLCRKSNFIAEGAVNMPGNTTLAEVVKLFRSQQHQQLTVGGGREPEPLEPLAGGTRAPGGDAGERELCQRHPHRKLQLFCKVCKQLACGQCVSEDHRGVFHAVNLVDMIYQEEKLEYFNNLRELRQLNNRLKVEIADNPSDLEYVLDYDKEIIITKIDRILEKVELKKRQLIDEIEKKKEWKERERKAQLERKRTQKKTIEEYLKECEKLVNECNPVNFLKVACDLNERVKSNLAIVLPTLEKHNELTCLQPHQFLVKPVLDSISALQLTKDTEKPNSILDTGNTASELRTGGYQFKTTLKMWKQPKEFKEPKFVPETIFEYGCLDQIWCISAKEDHQNMSPEELRYKHYQSYRKDWNCFVTEGYADSENNLEPSLSSVPVELLKTPDGVQKPHVKLFSFGQSIKKVKKKFRGNLYVPLPPHSGSTASIPSVSNSEVSSPCAFEKSLVVEDKKQKHDPVPPTSVQSETISSITSTVENMPTAVTASLPVTLNLCSTMASSDKTGECQQKLFSSGAISFAVSKCSSSPSKQKESSISNVGVGFLQPAVTCGSSPSSKLPSADTLTNKLKDQQALATSTGFTFEKPGSCCFIRIPTSTSTSVLHNKTICESTGKHMKHQNSQTSYSTSSTCISKVLLDSNGTSSSFQFGKGKEQCSQESSPKPDLFGTSGFLSGQVKPTASFSFFNSGTGTLDFSSKPFPSIKSTTKSSESLRNPENPACLTGSTVGREMFLQVPQSNVPTLNEEQFLSTTSRSTTPSFDFKLADSGIITSASTLFTSPSSGSSTSSRTLCEQSCVTSQSGFNPLKHVASSAETSSIFTRTNSIGSNSMVFTPAFGQEPTYSITQQQSTATRDSVTKVKEMSTSGLSISAETVALRNCKGLTPITPPDIARDVPDLVALTQVSKNDVPNLNEKPFVSTVGRSKSPNSDFKLENPDIVLSPPFLLASPSFVSTYSNSSSLSTPVAQNVLPTQNSTKPLNLFARCVETTSVCSRANSICFNAVTSLNQGWTPTVSQQQNSVRPADVAKVNEIQTSELSIYAEPSTFNRAHSSGLNCKDSSPVVNQQSSEKAPTDIGVETHKLKETLLAETLTSEPEIFHRIESANSGCVDFAAGFNKGLPSISTQQTQVPFVDDAIKTCKTKSVEVPKSTQQSVIGKIPFSQLGNATSIPENPLGRCSSDTDEEGKNPLIFGEQGCNTQVSHVTENQGYSDDCQSSVVTSEMEHPDSLTAKESPNLSRRRWTNIEPLNLSHTGDSACIPQSIASVASSFAEASNGNAQEDIKRIATDCSLFTATSPVFCPVFKFGAGNDFQFTLGTSNLTNSAESQEKNEEDCKVAQKTMLPSPPPVNDPATILDAENVLFSNRGKLYCFERMSLRWKERAFGEIRVLEDKITKLSRLVMWNATNKCCANHWITRDLELKHAKTSNCIWTWHALDYSENKQVLVEFAVHFKLKEMAQLFKQVIETVQSTTGIAELTKQKNDQNGNDDHTSLGASELKQGGKFLREMEEQEEDGDDVVMLSEVKPTPEQRALALELFLPPTFFCYKNRPGYQSSDDEEDSFETAVKKLYPNYNKFI